MKTATVRAPRATRRPRKPAYRHAVTITANGRPVNPAHILTVLRAVPTAAKDMARVSQIQEAITGARLSKIEIYDALTALNAMKLAHQVDDVEWMTSFAAT